MTGGLAVPHFSEAEHVKLARLVVTHQCVEQNRNQLSLGSSRLGFIPARHVYRHCSARSLTTAVS